MVKYTYPKIFTIFKGTVLIPQPSPLSTFRTFSSSQSETLYLLITNTPICFPQPLATSKPHLLLKCQHSKTKLHSHITCQLQSSAKLQALGKAALVRQAGARVLQPGDRSRWQFWTTRGWEVRVQQGEKVLKQKWEGKVTACFEVWPGPWGQSVFSGDKD